MYCSSLLILIFGFLTNYAHGLEQESIVGGDFVVHGQLKYQVTVQKRGKNRCGGGIISDRHVLTAAHCVIKSDGNFYDDSFTVLANGGTSKAKRNPDLVIVRHVNKIYALKNFYRERPKNLIGPFSVVADIAVLALTRKLGLHIHPNVAKLSLPIPHNNVYSKYVGSPAIIAGDGYNYISLRKNSKGKTVEHGGGSHGFIKYARAEVIANDVCQQTETDPVYEIHICARIEQRNPRVPEGVCTGDSGSPLVYDGTIVIGVLSQSPFGCNEAKSPAIYTRVSSYVDFIQNAINNRITSDMRVHTL